MKRQIGFRTHNSRNMPRQYWGGLRGYIACDKAEIEAVLGPSNGPSGDGKIEDEWVIEGFVDGHRVFATLYDYRGESEPMHIGGRDTRSLDLVKFVFLQAESPAYHGVTDRKGVDWEIEGREGGRPLL